MSKKPPTDEPTPEPTIEETLAAMSTAFLDEFDAAMQKYAREINTNWHGLTPTDRSGHALLLLRMAQTRLRKPAVGVDLTALPREMLGLR
jgi:hypothetical protein